MSDEVDEAMKNVLNVAVKSRYGEDTFVKNSIIICLVETPRTKDDGPDAPRFQLMLKALQPIQPSTAARLLQEAAVQFQRQKIEIEKRDGR